MSRMAVIDWIPADEVCEGFLILFLKKKKKTKNNDDAACTPASVEPFSGSRDSGNAAQ